MNKCIECGTEIEETNSDFYLDNLCKFCEDWIAFLKSENDITNYYKEETNGRYEN